VFTRRREIDELTEACARIEARLQELNAEREKLLNHLQAQESLQAKLKDGLSSLHIESVELRKERERLQLEVQRSERDLQALGSDVQRNEAALAQVRDQIEANREELATVLAEQEEVVAELEALEEQLATAARDFETLGQTLNEKRVERSRITEQGKSIEYRLESLQNESDRLHGRKRSLADQREREEKELANIDNSIAGVKQEAEQSTVDRNATQVQMQDNKNAFNDTCSRLNELRDQRAELQKTRETVGQELQELELKLAKEQNSIEQLRALSVERYQHELPMLDENATLDITTLPMLAEQLEGQWDSLPETDRHILMTEHLKALREKVGRYGEVNLTAIQEFDEIQKRYDFLMEQKADLENSIKILEEAILKIDESTKQRFEETFLAVNSKFKEIFPILFNGGKAELTLLQQSENPLDAGVDIMVHPPGKRPASITLLSGGEKALTAVSLVLAIFARKPSPFCLLDEVDAPLDDANVSRFNTVVRKMAEKTQFIVITHNKKTMEIAEALYGVTMERPGISRMASVRLN
jgi:chromosome segregation protein